jgi:hypothetical protein
LATALAAVISALVATAALRYTAAQSQATERQIAVAEQGQVTDRFTRAVSQLGDQAMDVRLGGIYGLERLARDSPRDQPAVVEVLSAYVRDRVPSVGTPACAVPPPPVFPSDLSAALAALSRRDRTMDQGTWADLDGVCHPPVVRSGNYRGFTFFGANLTGANLASANLTDATLTDANLTDANLTLAVLDGAALTVAVLNGAYLDEARLDGAYLDGAYLNGARLTGAHLTGAHLDEAHLVGAALTGADLTGATLIHADLTNADLTGAILTDADLTKAIRANLQGTVGTPR